MNLQLAAHGESLKRESKIKKGELKRLAFFARQARFI